MSARRKLAPEKNKRAHFDVKLFEQLAADLSSGRIPKNRLDITDEVVSGLRAVIRSTGLISFHVNYEVDGTRPFLKIGDYPDIGIKLARERAKTILALADKGIDVTEGLHTRLLREIDERGERWRP